ncbi:MAG: hypothetical protein O3B01_24570 [Planctomycetota bacterium]|nr:hypothetical protein [Planctomycetota bacterium]MDA1141750.1 hypothetical protein [Planctomycetota bacterium]
MTKRTAENSPGTGAGSDTTQATESHVTPYPGLLLSIVLSLTFCVLLKPAGAAKEDPESPEYWRDAQRSLAELGDGYLVWETRRTGTWQIWTINLDGTGLQQLTPPEQDREQQCPQISPDGTRVAYLSAPVGSGPSGGGQTPIVAALHLINRDGSGDRVIAANATKYGGWNRAVVWFNDNELAYINGEDLSTYRLNLATGQSTLLFKSQHGQSWLPNTKLDHVVASFNQISMLDGNKQLVTVVPSLGGCQPYPTADGNWVVWNHGCGGPIAKVNLTTRGIKELIQPEPEHSPVVRRHGGYRLIQPGAFRRRSQSRVRGLPQVDGCAQASAVRGD